MRVTEQLIYRNITAGLGRLNSDLQKLNQQIASGRRLLLPSDDPVGAIGSLTLRTQLDALAQQQRNAEAWRGWLRSTESSVSSAMDVVSRARELAVQMSNATYGAAQRRITAKEVDNLLEELVNLANTQYGGRYIFAGFREDSRAFEVTEAGGLITAVTYAGDDGHHEMKLGPNSHMECSLTGRQVFQGSVDLFAALISLRDALEANDAQAAAATIADLENAGNNLAAIVADVGSKVNRLELRLKVIEDTRLTETERLSELEDADLVEAVVALQTKEVAYQAALKSATIVQQLNLAAYL